MFMYTLHQHFSPSQVLIYSLNFDVSDFIFDGRLFHISGPKDLKGCVRYIFASLFLSLNESTCQTRKNAFFSFQNLFSFSRKSNFTILDFKVSCHHQMPKHKTRNTFY